MDPKRRSILVIAIAITIVAGIAASLGFPMFAQTPGITLPNRTQSQQPGEDEFPDSSLNGILQGITVTNDTVQSVIETLNRPDSYYRELTVELFWGPDEEREGSVSTVSVWADGGYVRTSEGTQQRLLAGGRIFTWYSGDRDSFEKEALSPDIDSQNIPTYETVLSVEPGQIINSGFVKMLEENCIYVEVYNGVTGYFDRYWISTNTGLLYAAATVKNDQETLTYRMTQLAMTEYTGTGAEFRLPNGAALEDVLSLLVGSEAEE